MGYLTEGVLRTSWTGIAQCVLGTMAVCVTGICLFPAPCSDQTPQTVWTPEENSIAEALQGLRSLADKERAQKTRQLIGDLRALPPSQHKVILANSLAHLAAEFDSDHILLQEVARTLARALAQYPAPEEAGLPAAPYFELAQLVRYEHVQATLESSQFTRALAELDADDGRRQRADFTLRDLAGRPWTLKSLRGKIVLVNFWATWCPPCRKELPDLESLYQQFEPQGLVILAVTDEDAGVVAPFVNEQRLSYTVLLDPGGNVKNAFHVARIPKTFVYDRGGKLAGESIDRRSRKQFLGLLAQAGLE